MGKQLWFKGPVCGTDNCRSRLYKNRDGLTICQFGHVLEGAVEFNDDQDQQPVQTRRLNVVAVDERGNFASQSSQRLIRKHKLDKLTGTEASPIFFRCLQIILKRQLEEIVKIYFSDGVKTDLVNIVKTYWCRALEYYYKVNDQNYDEKVNKRKTSLDVLDLLCIIYMASLELRAYPFYLSDIVECVTLDKVPYFKTYNLLPSEELERLHGLYHGHLQAYQAPTEGQILRRIFYLGPIILDHDLHIPSSYYFPFIYGTLAKTLFLPNTPDLFMLIYHFLNFCKKIVFEIPMKVKSANKFTECFPEVYLVLVTIYIVKLHFEFGGHKFQPDAWLKHVKAYNTEYEYNNEVSDGTLLNWSVDKTERYTNWVYNHLMSEKYRSSEEKSNQNELSVMEKRLFQIFPLEGFAEVLNNLELVMEDSEPSTPQLNTLKRILEARWNNDEMITDHNEVDKLLFSLLSKAINLSTNELISIYESTINQLRKAYSK